MRHRACAAAAALLAAALGIGGPAAARGADALATVSIAQPFVNVLPAGLWVAKDRGFFRKYGVDLQIVTFRGSTQAMQAMLAGQIPVMLGSPGQGLAAAAAGQDVIGLATIGAKMPYFFVVRPEIKVPSDLRGKSIGISGAGLSASRIALILAFKRLGLDIKRDNITLVLTGTVPERLAALRNNVIQGTVIDRTSEPIGAIAEFGFTILADFGKLNIPWEHDIIMTTRSYLVAHRAGVTALMKGLLEGNAYLRTPGNKRSSLRIIAEYLHYDRIDYAEALYRDAVDNFVYRKPYINREALAALIEIVKGEFPDLQKVNLNQFVDDGILRDLDRAGFIDKLPGGP